MSAPLAVRHVMFKGNVATSITLSAASHNLSRDEVVVLVRQLADDFESEPESAEDKIMASLKRAFLG